MQLPYCVTRTLFDYNTLKGLRVTWTRSEISTSKRTFCRMVYDGVGDSVTYHDSRCLSNMVRAVTERVFLTSKFEVVPVAKPGIFKTLAWISNGVALNVGRCYPSSRLKFCQAYVGSKRLRYFRALQTFDASPIITCADSIVKMFVKVEKINLSIKSDPAPRLISPRSDRYHIELGRYLKFIEHRIYDAIGKMCGGTTIAKGLNALSRGKLIHYKWRKFVNPVAVGLDAARFDQHCGVEALTFEHSLYRRLFPGDELLSFLLDLQLQTTAIGYAQDGKVRFTKSGGRCSGDINTSLGNCFISSALLLQYCLEIGIPPVFINDGDDSVLFCEQSELHLLDGLSDWFVRYGYTMKIETPVTEIEHVEFCQCKPVKNNDGVYTMVRNIRKALEQDLVSNKVKTQDEALAHCAAIRDAGLALNSGIPVMQAFYESLPTHAKKASLPEYGFTHMVRGMEPKVLPITDESRVSFYKAFNITPGSQLILEDMFCRKINSLITTPVPESNYNTIIRSYPQTRITLTKYLH